MLSGHGTVGSSGAPLRAGNLAVLGRGRLRHRAGATRQPGQPDARVDVLVLGGRPIREPVAWAGPFVMNTKAEVIAAFEDFQKGRLGTIPSVHGAPTTLQEG